jgi:hypothetical protein
MAEWNGKPGKGGWHWLSRRRDGQCRMAFYRRLDGWRVADAAGRTVIMSEMKVGKLFDHAATVDEPSGEGVGGAKEDGNAST